MAPEPKQAARPVEEDDENKSLTQALIRAMSQDRQTIINNHLPAVTVELEATLPAYAGTGSQEVTIE